MPIYEYHCKNCDQDFEYLVFGSEKPNCPACKGKKVSKLMSPPGHPPVAAVQHPVAPAVVTNTR
jgi:putative FmdB family regulatory protein